MRSIFSWASAFASFFWLGAPFGGPTPTIHGGFGRLSARADRNKGKRRKTGYSHPHSSTRQRARYARQLAAGQLSMAGAEGRDA